jgi:hypothetical protein
MKHARATEMHVKVQNLIADASREQGRLLENPPRTIHNLASAARQAARLQGEMIVLYEVEEALRYFVSQGADAPEEVLFHAAMSGARTPLPSSGLDAGAFAEGQRTALREVGLLVTSLGG